MTCPYCATQISTDAVFCPECGAKLDKKAPVGKRSSGFVAQTAVTGERKYIRRHGKKYLIPLAAALILVLGLTMGLLVARRTAGEKPVFRAIQTPEGSTVFFLDGRVMGQVQSHRLSSLLFSQDSRTACFLTTDGEVFLLTEKGCREIADQVFSVSLSQDGSTLACISEKLVLTCYTLRNMEATRVDKDVFGACLSPDGKTLAYYTLDSSGEATAWLFDGKDSRELSRDRIPLALSNGGKQIYCRSGSGKLYVLDGAGEGVRLASGLEDGQILLTSDHRQILFCAKGVLQVSREGGEPVSLGKAGGIAMLLQPGLQAHSRQESGFQIITVPEKDFGSHFYTTGSTLIYLDGKLQVQLISREAEPGRHLLSQNGKRLLFLTKDGRLCSARTAQVEDVQTLALNVVDFAASARMDQLWFVDGENTLWYQTLPGTPRLLHEQAEGVWLTRDEVTLYLAQGSLFACKDGSHSLETLTDVRQVLPFESFTLVHTGEGTYIAENGADFKPLQPEELLP